MRRYIDADAVLELIQEEFHKTDVNGEEQIGVLKCHRIVREAPTADVVEVVRCRDCKYWDARDSKGIQGICLCGEKDFYYGSEFYPFADDYCSYGERREDDGKS